MTTVDVYIDGGGERLSLHNGLFGPATTVYHAAYEASRDGKAVGGWNSSGGPDVTMAGRELRTILAKIRNCHVTIRGPKTTRWCSGSARQFRTTKHTQSGASSSDRSRGGATALSARPATASTGAG